MSRVGRNPIVIPAGVDVAINGQSIEVKGPKGSLQKSFLSQAIITQENNEIHVKRLSDSKFDRSYHGTVRQLINNMILGVCNGFEKKLKLVGLGYKASLNGNNLEMSLGYSHPIKVEHVEGLEMSVKDNIITVSGIDKEKVGLLAAKIKSKRKPDAYKGKGVLYNGEVIKLKEGKK
jgi:large subunit ribosomal protein L6